MSISPNTYTGPHRFSFLFRLKKVWQGQSMTRIYMNESLVRLPLRGRVIDIGGGRNPEYFAYMDQSSMSSSEVIDGKITPVDFEKDMLPFADASADTVINCNVLEHIFNHWHLVSEMHRILKPSGELIGFVPFIIQYHPDPRDYFRYTKEALRKIFEGAGFSSVMIKEVGEGPFIVNFNNIVLYMPRIFRVLLFPFYYALTKALIKVRPAFLERYPLGYTFILKK